MRLGQGENHKRGTFYRKLTMCGWGCRRERVHCKKPVSILDRVCDISSKIWVGGRLGRMILITLTWPSVAVVVHYYLRWVRCSAAHSRRGATARSNEEFNERTPWSIKVRTACTPGVIIHDGMQGYVMY